MWTTLRAGPNDPIQIYSIQPHPKVPLLHAMIEVMWLHHIRASGIYGASEAKIMHSVFFLLRKAVCRLFYLVNSCRMQYHLANSQYNLSPRFPPTYPEEGVGPDGKQLQIRKVRYLANPMLNVRADYSASARGAGNGVGRPSQVQGKKTP